MGLFDNLGLGLAQGLNNLSNSAPGLINLYNELEDREEEKRQKKIAEERKDRVGKMIFDSIEEVGGLSLPDFTADMVNSKDKISSRQNLMQQPRQAGAASNVISNIIEPPNRISNPRNNPYMDVLKATESGGNPNAVSPIGAAGKWQFIPPTARAYGLNVPNEIHDLYEELWPKAQAAGKRAYNITQGSPEQKNLARVAAKNKVMAPVYKKTQEIAASGRGVDERFNVEKATAAAGKMFNELLEKHNGNPLLAYAEYNGGPGAVKDGQIVFPESQKASEQFAGHMQNLGVEYDPTLGAFSQNQQSAQPSFDGGGPARDFLESAMNADIKRPRNTPPPSEQVMRSVLGKIKSPQELAELQGYLEALSALGGYERNRRSFDQREYLAEKEQSFNAARDLFDEDRAMAREGRQRKDRRFRERKLERTQSISAFRLHVSEIEKEIKRLQNIRKLYSKKKQKDWMKTYPAYVMENRRGKTVPDFEKIQVEIDQLESDKNYYMQQVNELEGISSPPVSDISDLSDPRNSEFFTPD